VITGDGDALAIGGNHFIHACRRNMDITVILVNNFIYGMTGGQVSPTTPLDSYAHTAPYGSIDPPFDAVKLAVGAGASYVARGTNYHIVQTSNYIKKAIARKGFSLVEVLSQCPVLYGRLNDFRGAIPMLKWQKEHSVNLKQWDKLSPEEKEGKYPIGEFIEDNNRKDYTEVYAEMSRKAREEVQNG